jgi:secreted PhoX family phosphatase
VPVEGPQRGFLRQFMSSPNASEVCGPEFTPDNRTLFCAIQHPGEGGTISAPVSTWPDGASPARPSVVAIQNSDGNRVIGR